MQQATSQAPSAPVIAHVQPGMAPMLGGLGGDELTAPVVRALRVRLRDLRNELQDAAERRNSIAGHLADADPGARPGYLARLEVLDTRILSIENEISGIVQRMGTAPASALEATTLGFQGGAGPIAQNIAGDIVPIVAILSVFVLAPIAIAFSRFIWRHAVAPPRPASDHVTQQRLEQLQQSVDTIAIEIERISEGQRFVTRVLNDRSISAGESDPLRAPRKAGAPGERG